MLETRGLSKGGTRPPKEGTEEHANLSGHLIDLLRQSERVKSDLYTRWQRVRDLLFIAKKHFDITGYGLTDEQANVARELIEDAIYIPYAYSILSSAMAAHYGMLAAGRPIFHVEPVHESDFLPCRILQAKLDADVDDRGAIVQLYRQFFDGYAYNAGILLVDWDEKFVNETKIVEEQTLDWRTGRVKITRREQPSRRTLFKGSSLTNVPPEDFFWDANYKISDFQRGAFAAHRYIESADSIYSNSDLVKDNPDPLYFNTEKVLDELEVLDSSRGFLFGIGESKASERLTEFEGEAGLRRSLEMLHVQAKIIPKRWKLGSSSAVETWRFSLSPSGIIMRAEPLKRNHGMFTYNVMEPLPLDESHVSPSMIELIGGLQDEINMNINAHRFEMQRSLHGTAILKDEAFDRDAISPFRIPRINYIRPHFRGHPSEAIHVIQQPMITKENLQMMGSYLDSMERSAGVSSLMQSVPLSGVRSATEVGALQAAGVSRMQVTAGLIGASSLRELGEMLAHDNMQFQDIEFTARMAGPNAEIVIQQMVEAGFSFWGDKGDMFTAQADRIQGNFKFPAFNPMFPAHQILQAESWIRIFEALANVSPALREQAVFVDFQKIMEEYMRSLGHVSRIPEIIRSLTPEEIQAQQQQMMSMQQAEGRVQGAPAGGNGGPQGV